MLEKIQKILDRVNFNPIKNQCIDVSMLTQLACDLELLTLNSICKKLELVVIEAPDSPRTYAIIPAQLRAKPDHQVFKHTLQIYNNIYCKKNTKNGRPKAPLMICFSNMTIKTQSHF